MGGISHWAANLVHSQLLPLSVEIRLLKFTVNERKRGKITKIKSDVFRSPGHLNAQE